MPSLHPLPHLAALLTRLNAAAGRLTEELRPWVIAIGHGGSLLFALALLQRPQSFRNAGFQINLSVATPLTWALLMIGTSAVGLFVLLVDRAAVWIPHGISIVLFAGWAGFAWASARTDPHAAFPIVSVVLSWIFAALVITDAHTPWRPRRR